MACSGAMAHGTAMKVLSSSAHGSGIAIKVCIRISCGRPRTLAQCGRKKRLLETLNNVAHH